MTLLATFLDFLSSFAIGFLVVSYWRGTWILVDIWDCGQPDTASLVEGDSFCFFVPSIEDAEFADLRNKSATLSYFVGMACLAVGVTMIWAGLWVPKQDKVTHGRAVRRFVIIYILGASAVNVWRGIWYWADAWVLPDNPLGSYWLTSLAGSTVAFSLWAGNSLLAPPAIFLLDGPGWAPPPVAVTLLSSHYSVTLPFYEQPPEVSLWAQVLDIAISFVALPFAVVWFWRGTWLLTEHYFWGFTPSDRDVHFSLLWNLVFAAICLAASSEPVIGTISRQTTSKVLLGLIGRCRTFILAWGTVSFWRLVWITWDEFLGGTSPVSAGLSHVIPIVLLTWMGCVSSVCAPASTLGVDSIPDEMASDEPLFSVLPIPYDIITLFAIARQPTTPRDQSEIEMAAKMEEAVDGDDHLGSTSKRVVKQNTTQSAGDESVHSGDSNIAPKQKNSTGRVTISVARSSGFSRYSVMQRSSAPRRHTEYAQRASSNKRVRSKLFKSR